MPAPYTKRIEYDQVTKDFLMELDGQPVGYARSYMEAENLLNELVYRLLKSGVTPVEPEPEPVSEPEQKSDLDALQIGPVYCETCRAIPAEVLEFSTYGMCIACSDRWQAGIPVEPEPEEYTMDNAPKLCDPCAFISRDDWLLFGYCEDCRTKVPTEERGAVLGDHVNEILDSVHERGTAAVLAELEPLQREAVEAYQRWCNSACREWPEDVHADGVSWYPMAEEIVETPEERHAAIVGLCADAIEERGQSDLLPQLALLDKGLIDEVQSELNRRWWQRWARPLAAAAA